MRFAIKTRPEHQTWEEIRDAWIAADEIPLFESAWNWDHFYPLTGELPDQSALYGVLLQIEALGLELVAVRRVSS